MPRKPAFISHSREREAQIQRRLLDVMEGRFRRFISAEIAAESERILSAYRELGFVPMDDDAHMRAIRQLYLGMAEMAIRTFGRRMTTQGKAFGLDLESKEFSFSEFFHSLALNYIQLEAMRRRITSVAETTRNMIVAQVERGQQAGLGVDAIAALIAEKVPGISRWRGALISRTELHAAANYGAQETAKQTGLELEKEWVAVEDHRTRDFGEGDGEVDEFDHRAMDGQTVGMDEPFKMPWLKGPDVLCQFPGDPTLPAAASINCRCAVTHSVIGLDD